MSPEDLHHRATENSLRPRELNLVLYPDCVSIGYWVSLRWHAHLARDFTGETPVPLFKLTHDSFCPYCLFSSVSFVVNCFPYCVRSCSASAPILLIRNSPISL